METWPAWVYPACAGVSLARLFLSLLVTRNVRRAGRIVQITDALDRLSGDLQLIHEDLQAANRLRSIQASLVLTAVSASYSQEEDPAGRLFDEAYGSLS